MSRVHAGVLIAGGGLAAQRCCETLRRLGFDEPIVVLCAEPCAPYDRPPLSKGALTGPHEPTRHSFRPAEWYELNDVELVLGVSARELDVRTCTVSLAGKGAPHPRRIGYRRLVVATGSRPRPLQGLPAGGVVHQLRSHDDALALRASLLDRRGRLAVLGAGLVGMEVAAAARAMGLEVTLIEAAATPLERALPARIGHWIADLHREREIEVRLSCTVEDVRLRARGVRLALSDGSMLEADTLLVAAGVVPATEWLASARGKTGALATDAGGRTGLPCVYAAGDAAAPMLPSGALGGASQHWEAAARQGAAVARSIMGLAPLEPVPPMFWSDQHGHRMQLVGHAAPDDDVTFDGDADSGAPFTAWFTRGQIPVGALLFDRPNELPRARRVLARASLGRCVGPEPRLPTVPRAA